VDPRDDEKRADGIKFNEFSVRALSKAVRKALVVFEHRKLFDRMRRNGMTADFSWNRTCGDYERVYRSIGVNA